MSTAVAEAPAAESADSEVQSFLVTFIIRRFDPENDAEPHWVDYDVELYSTDRVLDALHKIKWEVDGSLSFRRSCAHGICGSDAIAFGAINHLRAQGIDIPGRISVMGLGNTRLATLCTPRLTTVEMNFDLAGRAALDFITSHDATAEAPGAVIPHDLVVGESFSLISASGAE